MRKIARIVKIDKVEKHTNADTLDVCTIGGWNVVAKHGLHTQGDLVVYCEIDSWIPHTLAPFLTKEGKQPKVFEGVEGQVLKTIRLRGVLSQGLILPVRETSLNADEVYEGNDVSKLLGILKYEAPVPATLAGKMRCAFPGYVPKTDSERIQNLTQEFEEWKNAGVCFNITEKLDGTSATFMNYNGDIHVCSRNWSLFEDDTNVMWKMYHKYKIKEALTGIGFNCAIQGEVVGSSIQTNTYKLNDQRLFVFNIYNIDEKYYLNHEEITEICLKFKLETVPYIAKIRLTQYHTIENLLENADGQSELYKDAAREGLVFKGTDSTYLNFKAISNNWLIKNK